MKVIVLKPFDYAPDGFTIQTVEPSDEPFELLDSCVAMLCASGHVAVPGVVSGADALALAADAPNINPHAADAPTTASDKQDADVQRADSDAALDPPTEPAADAAPAEQPAAEALPSDAAPAKKAGTKA